MKLTRRESNLLLALILIIAVLLGTKYFVVPAYGGWQESKAGLEQLMSANASEHIESGSDDLGVSVRYNINFIPAVTPESLHYYFESFIKSNRLKLQSIDIYETGGELPEGFIRMDVTVLLSGAQEDIIGFLKDIDKGGDAIAIIKADLKPDNQTIALNADFHVYCDKTGASQSSWKFEPQKPSPADGFRFAKTKVNE